MKIAYFDAFSGISGDMTVGALLDCAAGIARTNDPGAAGSRTESRATLPPAATIDGLRAALATLELPGWRVELERAQFGAIDAASFQVIETEPAHHRDWATIRKMIEAAGTRGLSTGATDRALAIFQRLAEAEAKVHQVDVERVHFHEVGAVDSIIDIVGAAYLLDVLGVEACFVSPMPAGSGIVDTSHGPLPVPAPATLELLHGFDVVAGDGKGEMITPTGAAILAAMAKPLRPSFRLEATGCGAGTRRLDDRPNMLRVLIGDADETSESDLVMIEADIDDMTPEALAFACEAVRRAGARDVSVVTSQMKKNRLGMRVTALAELGGIEAVAAAMLNETTTIGVRYRPVARTVLARRSLIVDTAFGPIAVKVAERPDGTETFEPEFNDVARAAREHGKPFLEVRAAALLACDRT